MIVADVIHDHRERCLPLLIRLRMLLTEEWTAPSSGLAAEVSQATSAVLAQAAAANRIALAAASSGRPGQAHGQAHGQGHGQGPQPILAMRLAELAAAARDAVTAARSGNPAVLRERLTTFDAQASAIWTDQGVTGGWAVPPARTAAQRSLPLPAHGRTGRGGDAMRSCQRRVPAPQLPCRLPGRLPGRPCRVPCRLPGHLPCGLLCRLPGRPLPVR